MSGSKSKDTDSMDWWNDGKQPDKPASKPNSRSRSTSRSTSSKPTTSSKPRKGAARRGGSSSGGKGDGARMRLPLGVRLLINVVIIVVVVGVVSVASHFLLLSITRHGAHTSVPQFESMLIGDAELLAEESGLNLVINDSVYVQIYEGGLVLEQNPLPGVEVKPGRAVYVTINALQREMVDVPYVAGRSLRQAKNMLEIAGLNIGELIYEPDLATNYVLSQSYDNRTMSEGDELRAPRGSGIVLHVGINEAADSVVVPQLIGMSLYEARSVLLVSGLNVGRVSRDTDVTLENEKLAQVVWQSVDADSEVSLGSRVAFDITLDEGRVKRVLDEIEETAAFEQRIMAEEQAVLDSLNRLAVGLGVVAEEPEEQPQIEGDSGFEDLF